MSLKPGTRVRISTFPLGQVGPSWDETGTVCRPQPKRGIVPPGPDWYLVRFDTAAPGYKPASLWTHQSRLIPMNDQRGG